MRFTIFLAACVCLPLSAAAQPGRSQQSSRPGWPCAGKVDPAFVQTAEATGGKVLLFHPSELEGTAHDAAASRAHEETVFRVAGQLPDESFEFIVPIDSTIESAYFFVSLQCLQTVTLMTPSGQQLDTGSAGVEYHQFESVRMFVVPKPEPGVWRVTAAGRGFFSMVVSARSDLTLDRLEFGEGGMAEVRMSGALRQAAFYFVAGNAQPIQALQLTLDDESPKGRIYRGPAVKPREDFRLAVTGLDANGFQFQRMANKLSTGSGRAR